MSGHARLKKGAMLGTGAAIAVTCGFRPARVQVFNVDGLARAEALDGMASDQAVKHVAAGTMTFAADCIAINDNGFEIGVDADLNVADEQLHWMAEEQLNDD